MLLLLSGLMEQKSLKQRQSKLIYIQTAAVLSNASSPPPLLHFSIGTKASTKMLMLNSLCSHVKKRFVVS